MKTSKALAVATILLILAVLVLILLRMPQLPGRSPVVVDQQPLPVSSVVYACNEGKSLTAAFYAGTSTVPVDPTLPPTPTGTVTIALSDGRTMTLAQSISADGARYTNIDESFVFWSKGNGALILEDSKEKSFIGCIEVLPDQGGFPNIYQNATAGVSMRYPQGYSIDGAYTYQAAGPGKEIPGVKFTIPPSVATGTNLSSDSYLSVEFLVKKQSCNAKLFLGGMAETAQSVTDDGMTYSVASSSDAGAGNRYEETVYALPGTNPCIGVRYFIHYGVLENYPAGSVKAFDRTALISEFNAIRRTLVVNQ